jgi:hypothetical protein
MVGSPQSITDVSTFVAIALLLTPSPHVENACLGVQVLHLNVLACGYVHAKYADRVITWCLATGYRTAR